MDDLSQFSVGAQEVISPTELKKLTDSNRPLNVKLGVDPTSPDLHLGHAIVLRKLRQFQDAGHQAYLVIGDFTASIGDPAGVNKTRPVLTEAEIRHNMQTYLDQAGKVIDMEKTHIVYNSEWLKTMSLGQFIGYAMQISVNNLIEREDFSNRLKENQSVGLHELIYPLVQSIDSVYLKADVEIGGWDQRLNLLMGRELQKKLGQQPQVLILMKALIGTDGELKMSKSKNNYIGIVETPSQMFGKLMRISDSMIDDYGVAHDVDMKVAPHQPRDRKAFVAREIVALFNGPDEAQKAMESFDQTFKDRSVSAELVLPIKFEDRDITLIQAVVRSTGSSSSEARRVIEQRGVKINGEVNDLPLTKIHLGAKKILLQVGKHRFFELEYK